MDKKLLLSTLLMVLLSLMVFLMIDMSAMIGMVNSIFRMVIACSIFLLVLRYMDFRTGFKFLDWWTKADDKSKGLYLSARVIAVSFIVCACMA